MRWMIVILLVMAILGIWSLIAEEINKKISRAIREEIEGFKGFFREYKERKPLNLWWDYDNKANKLGDGFRGIILFEGSVSFRFLQIESFYKAVLLIRSRYPNFAPHITKSTLWVPKR